MQSLNGEFVKYKNRSLKFTLKPYRFGINQAVVYGIWRAV
jgi:hypothetical protein